MNNDQTNLNVPSVCEALRFSKPRSNSFNACSLQSNFKTKEPKNQNSKKNKNIAAKLINYKKSFIENSSAQNTRTIINLPQVEILINDGTDSHNKETSIVNSANNKLGNHDSISTMKEKDICASKNKIQENKEFLKIQTKSSATQKPTNTSNLKMPSKSSNDSENFEKVSIPEVSKRPTLEKNYKNESLHPASNFNSHFRGKTLTRTKRHFSYDNIYKIKGPLLFPSSVLLSSKIKASISSKPRKSVLKMLG